MSGQTREERVEKSKKIGRKLRESQKGKPKSFFPPVEVVQTYGLPALMYIKNNSKCKIVQ